MLLAFLNQYIGALTVLFTGVVAISTVIYAFLTGKLVSETRKLREVQTEPKISITIQPREEWVGLIDMVVQNIGLGPAYNIAFEVIPDFEHRKERFLSELGFMKKGLKYLAPNQELRFFLTVLSENYEQKIKTSFEVRVIYQNALRKEYSDSYLIDLSFLEGLSQLGEPYLYRISKSIEKIERNIDHLSTGFKKMKVVAYTKREIEEQEEEILRELQEAKQQMNETQT